MNPRQIPIIDADAHPPYCPMDIDHIGELSSEKFLDRLNQTGIGYACGRLTPPQDFFLAHPTEEAVSLLNEAAFALAAGDARYFPALWVHPDCPSFSIEQMDEYAARGVRMLEADAECLDHPGLAPILAHAQTTGMIVSLHKETLEQTDRLASQYPGLSILAGGLGSSIYMPDRTCALLDAHPNLYINLSGAVWSFNYVLHEWTQRLGTERLLFGTGYPFCNPASKVAAVNWELRDQPDSVASRLLYLNAAGLLGVERSFA